MKKKTSQSEWYFIYFSIEHVLKAFRPPRSAREREREEERKRRREREGGRERKRRSERER